MDDNDLITHLAVGTLDDPQPPQKQAGCFWLILGILLFGLLTILI